MKAPTVNPSLYTNAGYAEHYKVGMRNLMTYDRYPIFLEASGASAAEHSQNTNQAGKMKEKKQDKAAARSTRISL